jgi:cytochrome c oxidase subunit 2
MEGIINLHHDLMFFITFIFFFVLVIIGRTLYYFSFEKEALSSPARGNNVVHGTTIEIIWTVVPSLILVIVALPSFALLYSIDEVIEPSLTIKCVGHQWY